MLRRAQIDDQREMFANLFVVCLQAVGEYLGIRFVMDGLVSVNNEIEVIIPAFARGKVGNCVCMKDGIDAKLALACIIIQTQQCPFAKRKDGHQVDDAHDTHEDVGHVPGKIKA